MYALDATSVQPRRSSTSRWWSGLILAISLHGSSGSLRGLAPAGGGAKGKAAAKSKHPARSKHPANSSKKGDAKEFVCDWGTSFVKESKFAKANKTLRWPRRLGPLPGLAKQCLINHTKGLLDWEQYGGGTFNPAVFFTRNEALDSIFWLLNWTAHEPNTFHTTFWMRNGLSKKDDTCKVGDSHFHNLRTRKFNKKTLGNTHNITVIVDFRPDREQKCIGDPDYDPRAIRSVKQLNMEVIRKFAYIQLYPQMMEAGVFWPLWPKNACTRKKRCPLVVTMNGPGERTNDLYGYYSHFHPEHWIQDGRPVIYAEHLGFDKRCKEQRRTIQLSMQMSSNSWHYEKFSIAEHYEPLLRSFLHDHRDIIDFDRVYMYGMSTGGMGAYLMATIYASDVFSELIMTVPMGIWKAKNSLEKQHKVDYSKRRLRRISIAVGTNDIMYFTTLVQEPYALTMQDVMVWATESDLLKDVPVDIWVYPKVWHNAHPMIQNEHFDWFWRGGDPLKSYFLPRYPCGGTSVGEPLKIDRCPTAVTNMLAWLLAGLGLHLCLLVAWRLLRPSFWAIGRRSEAAQWQLHWWHPGLRAWLARPAAGARWQGYGEGGVRLRLDAADAARLAVWVPWRALRGRAGPAPRRALRPWFPGGLTSAAFNEVDRHVLTGHGGEAAYVSLAPGGGATSRRELLLRSAAAALALRRELRPAAGARVLISLPSDVRQVVWLQACKRSGWVYACCAPGLGAGVLASRLADLGACAALTLDAPPWRSEMREALGAYALLEEVCRVLAKSGLADLRGVRGLSPDGRVVPLRAVLERPEVVALHRDARRLLSASCLGASVHLLLLSPDPEGAEGPQGAPAGGLEAAFAAALRELAEVAPPGAGPTELVSRVWKVAGAPVALEADAPQLVAYPSDTAARQAGVAYGHGGYESGAAEAMRAVLGAAPGEDALLTVGDLGWIGGQAYQVTGPLCCRVTVALAPGPLSAPPPPQRLAEVLRPMDAKGPQAGWRCLRRMAAIRAPGWARGLDAVLDSQDATTSGRRICLATKRSDCILLGVPHELHGEVPLACVRWSGPAAAARRDASALLRDLMCNGSTGLAVVGTEVESLPRAIGGGAFPESMRSVAMDRTRVGGANDYYPSAGAPCGLDPTAVGVTRSSDVLGFRRYALDVQQPELVGDAEWWEPGIHSLYGIAVCMIILRHWLPDDTWLAVSEPAVTALPALRTSRFQINVFFALGGLEARLEDGTAAGRKEAVLIVLYLAAAWSYLLQKPYCDSCGATLHRWMLLWLVLARGVLSILLRTPFSAAQQTLLLYAAAPVLGTLGGAPARTRPSPGAAGAAPPADAGVVSPTLALLAYWAALYAAGYHWGPGALRLLRRPAGRLSLRCACGALFLYSLSLTAGSLPFSPDPEAPEAARDLEDAAALPRAYPLGASLEALQLAVALAACGRGLPVLQQIGRHAIGAYVAHPYWTMQIKCAAKGSTIGALVTDMDSFGGCLQLLTLVAFPVAFCLTAGTGAWYLMRIPMFVVSKAFVGGVRELANSIAYYCTVGIVALYSSPKAQSPTQPRSSSRMGKSTSDPAPSTGEHPAQDADD